LSPASDAFVLFLSRYRDELREYFPFNLPPADVVEESVDKRRLYDLAERFGVPHATIFYARSMGERH
jgi:predicted ATP-grasp superfamily ATP-dependent carboligase